MGPPPPRPRVQAERRWQLEDFDIGKPLGRGKFGNVYLAREKNSKFIVALKVRSEHPRGNCATHALREHCMLQSSIRKSAMAGTFALKVQR